MNININETYTNKEFSEALKELMEDKNWSYQQLADRAGITRGYISQIINKIVLTPKDEYIIKIATAFGLKPEYFREYRNRRLNEKMNPVTEPDKSYDVPLSPEDIKRLQDIISEAKEKFKK